jgi:hypothetical protein
MHRLRCGNTEGTSGALAEYALLREVRRAAPAGPGGPESGLCPPQHHRSERLWSVGLRRDGFVNLGCAAAEPEIAESVGRGWVAELRKNLRITAGPPTSR